MERGSSPIFDVLIFALLVSVTTILLTEFTPVDSEIRNKVYTSSLARNTLLTLQGAAVEGVGGIEYEFGGPSFLSAGGGETRRRLRHKTFAELIGEDAFLNLRAETFGKDLEIQAGRSLDEKLREKLELLLERILGGRFGYRFQAKILIHELDSAAEGFEVIVENLDVTKHMLGSETLILPLPAFGEESLENILGNGGLELKSSPVLGVTLELWSK